MQAIIIIIMLSIFTGLFANAGRVFFLWMQPVLGLSPPVFGVIYGVFVAAVLAFFVASRFPDSKAPRRLCAASHYGLGFLIYFMMLANIVSLLLFLGRAIRLLASPLPVSLPIGIAVLAISLALAVFGAVHGKTIRTKNYNIKLSGAQGGLKIALFSDLHLGYVIDEKHLQKIVTAINAAEPDIVCIAGDIFDGDITALQNPDALKALFKQINAPHGVYACLGNHDAGKGYDGMVDFLADAGIRLLLDEAEIIGNRFIIAGRRDTYPIGGQGEKRTELTLPESCENLPLIVMDHKPDTITGYSNRTGLILCGHTHKGQLFPFNMVTNAVFDVHYGYYQVPETAIQVIVTSGAGTWGPPQRIASDNEIAVIQIS